MITSERIKVVQIGIQDLGKSERKNSGGELRTIADLDEMRGVIHVVKRAGLDRIDGLHVFGSFDSGPGSKRRLWKRSRDAGCERQVATSINFPAANIGR